MLTEEKDPHERVEGKPDPMNTLLNILPRIMPEYEKAMLKEFGWMHGYRGGLLADWQIKARLGLPEGNAFRLVIDQFSPAVKEKGQISYGLSSYGYDLRLGTKFRIFANTGGAIVDPLDFKESMLVPHEGVTCIIPPNAYVLAESLERFEIPEDVSCIVLGKSTYARCGIGLNMTPLEPGWRGIVTLEIANHTPLPARVHARQGIGQVLFFEGSAFCAIPYNRKRGSSYQDQEGLVLPRA